MFTPLTSKVCSIKHPLDENHADQITEQTHEEDQLGEKFHKNLTVVPLTHFVPETWTENLNKEIEKNGTSSWVQMSYALLQKSEKFSFCNLWEGIGELKFVTDANF